LPHDDRVLLVAVGPRRLALPARAVAGVLPLLPLWRPPACPRPLAGFLAERGRALPVIALGALLGDGEQPAGLYAHIVRLAAAPLALLVDRAEDVVAAPPAAPLAPGVSVNDAIVAELPLADGIAHLLAVDRLLLADERVRLAELAADADRRLAEWTAS
jgi:purine-binding chemotaxis protein CheW